MRLLLGSIVLLFLGCGHRPIHSLPPHPVLTDPVVHEIPEEDLGADLGPDDEDSDSPDPMQPESPPDLTRPPHPFVDFTDKQIADLYKKEPGKLGSISVGQPASGRLLGSVQMQPNQAWHIVNAKECWGTQETVDFLAKNILSVFNKFPNSPKLPIGDISDEDGGYLRPHLSHQSGRDVDVGYYYTNSSRWYTNVTTENLDFPRTWQFIRSIVIDSDVKAIFMDIAVQRMLKDYGLSIGEDPTWMDHIFGGPLSNLRPIVSHEPGHRSHLHIRYYNPIAQETGRRLYSALLKEKKIQPPTRYVSYKVKRGDNLNKIAKRFRTTVKALKRANRLKSNKIIANRTYKIPKKGGVAKQPGKVRIPARRLPPHLMPKPSPNVSTTKQIDSRPIASK